MSNTTRRPFAGTGKSWFNGTLFGEAGQISVKTGGNLNRAVTTGYSGETREDPNKLEVDFEGQILKRNSLLTRLLGWQRDEVDVAVKVQVGGIVTKGVGKIGEISYRTENGKTTFSAKFMGDIQR